MSGQFVHTTCSPHKLATVCNQCVLYIMGRLSYLIYSIVGSFYVEVNLLMPIVSNWDNWRLFRKIFTWVLWFKEIKLARVKMQWKDHSHPYAWDNYFVFTFVRKKYSISKFECLYVSGTKWKMYSAFWRINNGFKTLCNYVHSIISFRVHAVIPHIYIYIYIHI